MNTTEKTVYEIEMTPEEAVQIMAHSDISRRLTGLRSDFMVLGNIASVSMNSDVIEAMELCDQLIDHHEGVRRSIEENKPEVAKGILKFVEAKWDRYRSLLLKISEDYVKDTE